MAQEEIEIEISPAGKVTVKTKGIKGPTCMEYADLFVRLLGHEEHREKTPEYYEAVVVDQKRHVDLKQRW